MPKSIPHFIMASVLYCILLNSFVFVRCGDVDNNKQDDGKIDFLRGLVLDAVSDTGIAVANLNSTGYKNFVLKAPKPYHVFIMLTAKKEVCRVCPVFEEIFEHVGISHYAAGAHEWETDPAFFVQVDIYKNKHVAELHGLRSLPMIVHASHVRGLSKNKQGILTYKSADSFSIRKLDHTSQEILDWANAFTSNDVKLYYTPMQRVRSLVLFLMAAAAFVGIVVFGVRNCRKYPILVVVVALAIQHISTSGIFYNILHGFMLFGRDDNGNPQMVVPSFRGQYLGEGLCMSGMVSMCGLLLLATTRLPYTSIGAKMSPNTLGLLILVMATCALCSVWGVFSVYKLKVGWHEDPPFFPPGRLKRGPVYIDHGNSF